MLDAIYVGTLEIITLRPESGIALVVEPKLGFEKSDAAIGCFWWRRGSPELYDNNPALIAEERWEAMPVG